MSPGKKALVLLELIVNLEKGKCPILIDQPEDDLDNRSIYTDLVKYLKDKKHEGQLNVLPLFHVKTLKKIDPKKIWIPVKWVVTIFAIFFYQNA